MKRLLLLVVLLTLAACAPRAEPVTVRDGEQVIITIAVNQPIYNATMSVLRADSDDARCFEIGVDDRDLACVLGDLSEATSVTVTGNDVTCVVFGHTDVVQTAFNLRPFPCKTGE